MYTLYVHIFSKEWYLVGHHSNDRVRFVMVFRFIPTIWFGDRGNLAWLKFIRTTLSEQCLCTRRRLSNKRNVYSTHFDDGIYVVACSEINTLENFINVKCGLSRQRWQWLLTRKSIIQIYLEAKYAYCNFITKLWNIQLIVHLFCIGMRLLSFLTKWQLHLSNACNSKIGTNCLQHYNKDSSGIVLR